MPPPSTTTTAPYLCSPQDLENLFWGLVLAFTAGGPASIYYNSLSARTSMLLAIIAFTLTFTVARVAHTTTYLLAMSGARSLSWLVGVLSVLGVALVVSLSLCFHLWQRFSHPHPVPAPHSWCHQYCSACWAGREGDR